MVTAQQAIEWNHPLNRGLIYCGRLLPGMAQSPYGLVNLATRRPPYSVTSPTLFGMRGGRFLGGHGLHNQSGAGCSVKADNGEIYTQLSTRLTFAFVGTPTDATNALAWMGFNNNYGTYPLLLGFSSSKASVVSSCTTPTSFTGATTVSNGVCYHVAATIGAGGTILYLNGRSDGSGTYDGSSLAVTPLEIGANVGTFNPMFGTLHEARVWNRELTAAEIMALYREAVSGNRRLYRYQAAVRATAGSATTKYSWWAWGTYGSV